MDPIEILCRTFDFAGKDVIKVEVETDHERDPYDLKGNNATVLGLRLKKVNNESIHVYAYDIQEFEVFQVVSS